MPRVSLLIWLLLLSLVAGHLGATVLENRPCCCDPAASENIVEAEPAAEIASASPDTPSCCRSPSERKPAEKPDHRDHDPCRCPAKCCVAGPMQLTNAAAPLPFVADGRAPRFAAGWREPLSNPTLDRLKRPPRTHATA